MHQIFTQRTSSEVTIAAGFSLMVAILFSGSAIFAVQKARIFAVSAKTTKAEVVEIIKERQPANGNSNADVLIPVFQYKVDGAVFERRAEPIHLSDNVPYSVGDTTVIYYNPENPSEIRDILRADSSKASTFFGGAAAIAWFLFAAFSIHSFRLMRFEARGRKPTATQMIETKCLFVALEATNERVRNARMIRLVCRWIHPETGTEWLIRSASIHPTEIPIGLELGASVTCKIDFDNPLSHEVLWTRQAEVHRSESASASVA